MRAPRSTYAFVLAGGGSLGAVEVGMLRALAAAGITPDLVVGSSVGAINGAYFASDPTRERVDRLEGIWRSLRRWDVFPLAPLATVLGLLSGRDHLVDPGSLRGILERHLSATVLEKARVPCHVVATDLWSGDAVRLSEGPAVDALLASTAIPGIFPPVRISRGSSSKTRGASRAGSSWYSCRRSARSASRRTTSRALRS
jgi:NTE family protein